MPNTVVPGRCLCGAVQFEVTGPPFYAVYCHCSNCRHWTGSAVSTSGGYMQDQLRIVSGQDHIRAYESSPGMKRHFCGTCGSSLYAGADDGGQIWLALGTLQADPGLAPQGHIQVSSKPAWFSIADDLPQYQEWPPQG